MLKLEQTDLESVEKEFYQLFVHKGVKPQLARKQAKIAADAFKSCIGKENANCVLLTGYNEPDGVGDFVNLLDYYVWMKHIFIGFNNVKIKGIAIVSVERLPVIDLMLKDVMKAQDVYVYDVTTEFDFKSASKAELIILSYKPNLVQTNQPAKVAEIDKVHEALSTNPYLSTLFQEADFLLNIATPFERSEKIFLQHLRPNCWVRSRLEYGPTQLQTGEIYTESSKVYVEDSMGIAPNEVGIKFNDLLYAWARLEAKGYVDVFLKLDKPQLLLTLFNIKYKQDFTEKLLLHYQSQNALAIGYLQQNIYTLYFIELFLAISDKKNVDAIINTKHFQFEKSESFLREHGVKKVMVYDCEGNDTNVTYTLTFPTGNRHLRLFAYNGLSNQAIMFLMARAELAGGSGDNSFSNILATPTFPFFGILSHKIGTMEDLIKFVQNTNIKNKHILADYLSLLIKLVPVQINEKSEVMPALKQTAKANLSVIKDVWRTVSDIIYTQHNAKYAFYELIYAYLFVTLLSDSKKLKELQDLFDKYKKEGLDLPLMIANESLLYLALIKRNVLALEFLLASGADIEACTERFNLSPLLLAAHLKYEEGVICLIKHKAKINVYAGDNHLLFLCIPFCTRNAVKLILEQSKITFYEKEPKAKEAKMQMLFEYLKQHKLADDFLKDGPYADEHYRLTIYYAVKTQDKVLLQKALVAQMYTHISWDELELWGEKQENTLLHLAVSTGEVSLIQLLAKYSLGFYDDVKNAQGKRPSDLTEQIQVKEIISKKSYRMLVKDVCQVEPEKILVERDNQVTVQFYTFEGAWKLWQKLKSVNAICNRPRQESPFLISLPRELFEGFLQGKSYPTSQVDTRVQEVLELKLPQFLKENADMDVKVESHGSSGLVFYAPEQPTDEALQILLQEVGIKGSYCAADKSIELTKLTPANSIAFRFLVEKKGLAKQLEKKTGVLPELKLDLEAEDVEVIVKYETLNAAWDLWECLNKQGIVCRRPNKKTNYQLTLPLEKLQDFLEGVKYPAALPHEDVPSILQLDLTTYFKLKFEDVPTVKAHGNDGIVFLFNNEKAGEKFANFLEKKYYIKANCCEKDYSVEVYSTDFFDLRAEINDFLSEKEAKQELNIIIPTTELTKKN